MDIELALTCLISCQSAAIVLLVLRLNAVTADRHDDLDDDDGDGGSGAVVGEPVITKQ